MYFLNTDSLHEFSMHSTRIGAKAAMDNVALDTNVTYRPLRRDEMIKTFPFIRSADASRTSDWSAPVFHDDVSMLDCIPDGWQKPWFMETMLMSLKAAIQADGMDIDRIYMTDAKEKYGSLRMDFSTPVTEGHAFSDMCLAWEELAGYFCCMCGKPHVSISRGWICPYCKDCWNDINGPFKEVPLENPKISTWENGERNERVIDLKPLYDRVVSVWEDTNVK
jgi:hypothetical protein